jgi:hypothetical protein
LFPKLPFWVFHLQNQGQPSQDRDVGPATMRVLLKKLQLLAYSSPIVRKPYIPITETWITWLSDMIARAASTVDMRLED